MLHVKPSYKRFIISLMVGLALGFCMIYLYLFMPQNFHSLDDRLRDFLFLLRGEVQTKAPVVVVDIDEKSIKNLGQFPWDRKIMSNLLDKITSHNPIVIGLDIVFSERDKRSPSHFASSLKLEGDYEDYDKVFAQTLFRTPTILGYVFDFELEHNSSVFIGTTGMLKHKEAALNSSLPKAVGVLANLQIFHDNAYSSGFFNTSIGYEHKVRLVPTVISFDKNAYLSLDMEIYRAVMGFDKTTINYLKNNDYYDIDYIELKSKDRVERINVDPHGQVYVNFRGKGFSYKYISAYDVLNDKVPTKELKDKIVLVGTSAKGLVDLRATPMDNSMPGVEVHANLIDNFINQDYIHMPQNSQLYDMLIIMFISLLVTVVFSYFSPLLLGFLGICLGILFGYFYYYLLFTKYLTLNILYPLLTLVTSIANALIIGYFFEQKQKEFIKSKFASKVSKNVMDDLMRLGNMENLFDGRDKDITIFFSDIRSFSTLSETLEPKVLIKLLNEYMSPMTEFITKRGGTIDKFIGDAIMAYWNAPQDVKDHADKAIECALEQIKYKEILNANLKEKFGVSIDFGIGINTGLAVVGEMGSIQRSDYTALGNNVNIASRLEGLCHVYGVNIIFSELTKANLKNSYNMLKIDKIRVKGIHQPLEIYTILDTNESYLELFNTAFDLYQEGKFVKAKEYFDKLDENVSILLKKLYQNRCEEFIQNPPDNFDGVCTYMHK